MKIKIIESVSGNKPSEQIDFLTCSINERTKNIIAYLKGNGYVKLFHFQHFFDWYVNDVMSESEDITQDLYNTDEEFEYFITINFFNKKGSNI